MSAAVGDGDIRGAAVSTDWLVVGWFTPDYRHWAERLAHTLDGVEAPYHLKACKPSSGYWERETMRKPGIVREFQARYPERTLILLDADSEVRRCLQPLARSVRGDVAALVRAKTSGRGKERARIKVMSGTMVFRPTAGAVSFVDAWEQAIEECDSADVDQTALMIALGRVSSFTFEPLGTEWCAFGDNQHPDPAIWQDNAGRYAVRAAVPSPRQVLQGFVKGLQGRLGHRSADPGRMRRAARPDR